MREKGKNKGVIKRSINILLAVIGVIGIDIVSIIYNKILGIPVISRDTILILGAMLYLYLDMIDVIRGKKI